MASVISFLIIIAISLLITRIAAVAFSLTGLSRDIANFQALSAFTGVGFTTSEAESILRHPIRRKIAMLLMLLGNAGIVSAVASLVITFTNESKTWYSDYVTSGIIILSILLIWLIYRSKYVKKGLDKIISFMLRKYTDLKVIDYEHFLNRDLEYDLDLISIGENHWLANKTMKEVRLKEEGIVVLGIERDGSGYIGVPDGDFKIKTDDVLKVYGRKEAIQDLSDRKLVDGDKKHKEAVLEEENIKDLEREFELKNRH